MQISLNANIKLIMGGRFCGYTSWNKKVSDIDNCFKLYRVHYGEARIHGKSKSYTLQENGLYFINGFALQSQECLERIMVDWVHFLPESVYLRHVLRHGPCHIKIDNSKYGTFAHVLDSTQQYFENKFDEAQTKIVQLELQAFIHYATAQVLKTMGNYLFDGNEQITRLLPALEFITNNYSKATDLKEIASTCFISPNYFHRLFTSVFKISPQNYIKNLRLEEAIRQLVYSSRAVKEIAFAVGYEDEAYFSRVFTKSYGTSPGKYRKLHGKKLP